MRVLVLALVLSGVGPTPAVADAPRSTAFPSATIDTLRLNLAALAPRRDSFAVRVQGEEIGWQRVVLERTADGFRYTEETRLPGMRQRTVLRLSGRGEMRSVEQRGTARGQEMRIDLRYGNGRAVGRARTPSAPHPVRIDAPVPAHVVDDNAIQALLPALPWAPTARWTFPVFSSGTGALREFELRVTGTETVIVPAGTFEAYRAELQGGAVPVTFWVSTTAPHRLVRVAGAAMPFEFVRATR